MKRPIHSPAPASRNISSKQRPCFRTVSSPICAWWDSISTLLGLVSHQNAFINGANKGWIWQGNSQLTRSEFF